MIISIIGIAFDCPNANELADFYTKLLGWEKDVSFCTTLLPSSSSISLFPNYYEAQREFTSKIL